MNELIIVKPDDMHLHLREGAILKYACKDTAKQFGRAIVMPNLKVPITTVNLAEKYYQDIKKVISNSNFEPLMTLFFSGSLNNDEIKKVSDSKVVHGIKLYPSGVTTNSDNGIDTIEKCFNIFELMQEHEVPLLIHGESNDKAVDIFDREKVFIEKFLSKIIQNFPELKITLEHITTKEAKIYVNEGNKNLVASITPHHLALNRNAIFVGGIRPHNYCLPILKREHHRKALIEAAVSGNPKFFLGTDTAPHLTRDKESSCGCAGIFNSTYCMSILAQLFDDKNALTKLESFVSRNGAKHYNLDVNKEKILLIKSNKILKIKKDLTFNNQKIKIFNPGFAIYWDIKKKNINK